MASDAEDVQLISKKKWTERMGDAFASRGLRAGIRRGPCVRLSPVGNPDDHLMKRHGATIALGLLIAAFVCLLVVSATSLPARVASHFDGGGRPNGWMSRSSYLIFVGAFGLGLPAILVLGFRALRYLPADLINLPRRDYWLAPERRAATVAALFQRSLWLACLLIAMMLAVHLLVVHANNQVPVRLSTPMILGLMALFLAGIAAWILSLYRHFNRTS